jgi:hypothetical protein
MPCDAGKSLGWAWFLLSLAVAAHVADEALAGFLNVCNPAVISIRERLAWLPLPVFRFDVWLGGLAIAVAGLFLLAGFAFRGAVWIRPAVYVLAVLMTFNALSHAAAALGRTVESVQFAGPIPGFYPLPLLLAASIHLLVQLHRTRRAASDLP